ncbi:MAG: fibronectin type III domain-containing protein [Clostridia bacterium]|nr:fibronectin type III domain-containing protein [Clostridia bacterium]
MKKKFVFILALAAASCACVISAACNLFGKDGGRKGVAPVEIALGEITDSSIEVIDCVYAEDYAHYVQLSLDGNEWTEKMHIGEYSDSYVFENLEPNTEYTVYARTAENGDTKPSDAIQISATTLRAAASGIPEGVDFTQEYGKITLTNFTSAMEASFNNGATYTDSGEHTYTRKGAYKVLVRFKQTDKAFASEPCSIDVHYIDYYGGLGTEEKPYLINTYDELLKVSRSTVTYYKLISDITFPTAAVGSISLKGNLDGNGKKLISPKIDTALNGGNESGLFSSGTNSTIKNLTVENIIYTLNKRPQFGRVGLLTDETKSVVNCHVSGEMIINEVSSSSDGLRLGGIAGNLGVAGKIENCTADVTFTVQNGKAAEKSYDFGGIAGNTSTGNNEITGCSAKITMSMTAENSYYVSAGGIAGEAYTGTKINKCSAQVQLSALGAKRAEMGGIAGSFNARTKMNDCIASGQISASGDPTYNNLVTGCAKCYVGGIAAGSYINDTGSVKNCISSVDLQVDGTDADVYCAGIIARTKATDPESIENCLYTGTITVNSGTDKQNYLGGIAGNVDGGYTVENCFVKSQSTLIDCTASGISVVNNDEWLSASWQRANLNLDETVWTITDGKLPELK